MDMLLRGTFGWWKHNVKINVATVNLSLIYCGIQTKECHATKVMHASDLLSHR
jgi:hypothetical protein